MKLEELIKNFRLKPEERKTIIGGDKAKDQSNKEQFIPASFKEIAKCILSGHFEVSVENKVVRNIYPTCVEIYYHEESDDEDAIKDYIVYHRNTPSEHLNLFQPGTINAHQSGIDITFEHQDCNGNVVRASALIRKFRIDFENNDYMVESTKYPKEDDRSTFLYEALFTNLPICKGFMIKWKDEEDKELEIKYDFRQNVLPYKLAADCSEEEKKNKPTDYAYKAKDEGPKNDGRCWQFSKK